LVLVLWVLVLLTVMAASFSQSMRRETEIVRNAKNRSEAGSVAEAGIYYAMIMQQQTDQLNRWRDDGTIYEFRFANSRVRVQIFDESGKFDINKIKDSQLIKVVESVGLSYEEAANLVDVILDWRDPDDFKRINGAEESEYRQEDRSYGPRNKAFQSIEELQLVLGVNAELYAKLKPLITVYTGNQQIDPMKAPKSVLMTLPDINEDIVDVYLQQRTESALNKQPPPPFPAGEDGQQLVDGSQNDLGETEGTYSIRSEALLPGDRGAAVSAVVKFNGENDNPLVFLEFEKRFGGDDSLFNESLVVGADVLPDEIEKSL